MRKAVPPSQSAKVKLEMEDKMVQKITFRMNPFQGHILARLQDATSASGARVFPSWPVHQQRHPPGQKFVEPNCHAVVLGEREWREKQISVENQQLQWVSTFTAQTGKLSTPTRNSCRWKCQGRYSGDPNSKLVWYSNSKRASHKLEDKCKQHFMEAAHRGPTCKNLVCNVQWWLKYRP